MIALLLAGCADVPAQACTRFADIAVTNPDGGATPDALAEVRAAIDQFAGWSARDGLCVDEVRLVAEVRDREEYVAGSYQGRLVEIDEAARGPSVVVTHALCHAADNQAAWFSDTRPDWFGEDDPHEVFAEACAEGPRAVALLDAVEAACGKDLGAARQRWLNAEVFGAAEVGGTASAGTLALAIDRRTVTGQPNGTTGRAYAGGTAVYRRVEAPDLHGVRRASLVRVDLADGTARVIAGPRVEGDTEVRVLPADTGPLVVLDGAAAWRLDEAAETFAPVPFVVFDALEIGAVFDGAAWVVGTAAGEAERTLSRVDLGTGARAVVAWPDGVETWQPLPDGDALAGWAWHADDARVWLRYTPESGVWTRPPRPDAWDGGQIVTLPDGRLLATWLDDVGASEEGGLAVSDATGAWWLPEAPCGEDAVGLSRELLSVGGEPWLWEYRGGWYGSEVSGGEGDALTRVEVSP